MAEAAAAVQAWWATAAVSTAAGATVITYGQIVIATALVYGNVQQRSAARKMARAQRDAYNNSLTDRTVSVVSADNPWPVIYGEAVVAPSYVAILTSGDKDQFKHLVGVWAAHRCNAITQTVLSGEVVGSLDGSGNVTGGRWSREDVNTVTETLTVASGAVTLSNTPDRFMSLSHTDAMTMDGDYPVTMLDETQVTVSGTTVTLLSPYDAAWAGFSVQVTYEYTGTTSLLRLNHHVGSDTQTADAGLLAELPAEWTSNDRGRGLTYSVGRFDLNEPEFQGGPPQWLARVQGNLVYDPRLDSTQPGGSGAHRVNDPSTWAFSKNVALNTAHFLMAEYGKRALATQVVWASVVAAANVCDEVLTVGASTYPRYTCNGRFTTADEPDTTLEALCQAMAGFATFMGGAWYVQAGAYTAPVMALTDDDNAGSVEMVPGPGAGELLNGLRGRFYDPDQFDQWTDYTPYSNAAFVTEDGGAYWGDLDLPFTDAAWRAHNLARILVERSRGMQIVYPAKMRAVRLLPGQRITLTCSALNLVGVVFRVVKREYQIGSAVKLTLVFDDPSFYDEVDAPTPLVPPTVSATNPYVVAPVTGLVAESGSGVVLRDDDGSVLARVLLSYDASADVTVRAGGALQIEYRLDTDATWQRAPEAAGDSTEAYVPGLRDQRPYVIRVRWRNAVAYSAWRSVVVMTEAAAIPVAAPPSGAVSGLSFSATTTQHSLVLAVAGLRFNSDGTVGRRSGTSSTYVTAGNWYTPTTAAIGATHWVRVTTQSGSTAPMTGPVGSWVSLATAQTWTNSAGTIGDDFESLMDFEIATSAGGTPVVASGVLSVRAIGTAP